MFNWTHLEQEVGNLQSQWNAPEKPFPFLVLDGILDPNAAREIVSDFDTRAFAAVLPRRQQKHDYLKRGTSELNAMSMAQQAFFEWANSPKFIAYLEKVTGITGISADPYLLGGGLHEILRGGRLNIHTDFNFHPRLKKMRRLNLIVYLNEAWQEEWGGQLELWNADLRTPVTRIPPLFNRAALFETSEVSFHGHPKPLACPDDRRRRSLAVYYYTDWPEGHITRNLTNYKLIPSQWAELTAEIAPLIEQGLELPAITGTLNEQWQSKDVEAAYTSLCNLRTWTLYGESTFVTNTIDAFNINPDSVAHAEWMEPPLVCNDFLKIEGGLYISSGEDPYATMETPFVGRDVRRFLVRCHIGILDESDMPKFYFDFGKGTTEANSRVIPAMGTGTNVIRFICSHPVRGLRFDPSGRGGTMEDFRLAIAVE